MGARASRGVFVAVLLLLLGNGAGLTAPADFIHADGKRLVDSHGNTFAVKGINLGNWLYPEAYMFQLKSRILAPTKIIDAFDRLVGPEQGERFWTTFRDVYVAKEDIDFLKAAGFNTVRVPMSWRLFVERGGDGAVHLDGPGWALIDRLVQWCRDDGIRVILDMHSAPGGQTGHTYDDGTGYPLLFYVPQDRRLTFALWKKFAARYRDEPAVLGYDLINEPISPFNDMAYLNPRLDLFYHDLVGAIRSVDPNHAVLLGGAQWDTNFGIFGRPFDANAVYTFHKFWFDPDRAAVQEYINYSNQWNVPVIMGETGEYSDAWNAKARKVQEQIGIGWIFWTYKKLDSTSGVASIRKPAGWDIVADAASSEDAPPPPRERMQSILDAYLEAAKFKNVQINAGYVRSLGMSVPPGTNTQ
jgi:endoglucanase